MDGATTIKAPSRLTRMRRDWLLRGQAYRQCFAPALYAPAQQRNLIVLKEPPAPIPPPQEPENA